MAASTISVKIGKQLTIKMKWLQRKEWSKIKRLRRSKWKSNSKKNKPSPRANSSQKHRLYVSTSKRKKWAMCRRQGISIFVLINYPSPSRNNFLRSYRNTATLRGRISSIHLRAITWEKMSTDTKKHNQQTTNFRIQNQNLKTSLHVLRLQWSTRASIKNQQHLQSVVLNQHQATKR